MCYCFKMAYYFINSFMFQPAIWIRNTTSSKFFLVKNYENSYPIYLEDSFDVDRDEAMNYAIL